MYVWPLRSTLRQKGQRRSFVLSWATLKWASTSMKNEDLKLQTWTTRKWVGENQWTLTICGLLYWFRGTCPLTWHTYGISPGLWVSFMCSSRTCSVSNANSHILQLAEEKGWVSLVQSGYHRACVDSGQWCLTGGRQRAVGPLHVALQLVGRQVLPVAVLAGGVALPALTVLLLQLQVVLHVVHESGRSTVYTSTFTLSRRF